MSQNAPPPVLRDLPIEVALDFINTLEHSRDHDTEHIPDRESLEAWLADHGLLARHDPANPSAENARLVADAHALRRALRAVFDARVDDRAPQAADIDLVNRWLGRRPSLRLVPVEKGVALAVDDGRDPVRRALALIAEAGARGVAADDRGRLRVCANDECRWAFHDTSRGGRRKWCDMSLCGNRAKARRHRERAASPSTSETSEGAI